MDISFPPLTFETPSPLSLNNCYADVIYRDKVTRQYRVRRVPTDELKAYKQEVSWIAKTAANSVGWTYREGMQIELHILMFFKNRVRRDLSNRIKPMEDAIAEVLGFDDSWMTIHRLVVDSGGIDPRPRAIVTLNATLSTTTNITPKERKTNARRTKQRVGELP